MKAQTYLKLSAPNDVNGNPRRLYIVHETNALNPDVGATRKAIIFEGYNGNSEVRSRYPMACPTTEIEINGAEYKRWKQVKNAQEKGEEEEVIEIIKKKSAAFVQSDFEPKPPKLTKKTLEKLGRLGADFARNSDRTIQEGADMAWTRFLNSPQSFM